MIKFLLTTRSGDFTECSIRFSVMSGCSIVVVTVSSDAGVVKLFLLFKFGVLVAEGAFSRLTSTIGTCLLLSTATVRLVTSDILLLLLLFF